MSDDESPIKLVHEGYGYRWQGTNVPQHLRGLWLGPAEARSAARGYLEGYFKRKERKGARTKTESTPLQDLDLLSKKEHLLEFAVEHEVEVPQEKKMPSQIKAFIKKTLEKRNG